MPSSCHWPPPVSSYNLNHLYVKPGAGHLVGRFNKELSYLTSPFFDLVAAARNALSSTDTLIVSGYSFGDKTMNTILLEWLLEKKRKQKRLIVAHQDPDSLVARARGAIANKWDTLRKTGFLHVVDKYLSNVTWDDLRSYLN